MWKSTDGGVYWLPLFDRQLSLSVGEPAGIAIDPKNSNILYLGTSDRRSQISSILNTQPVPAGLFKSNDGGQSWIILGANYPDGNTGNAIQFFEDKININVVIVDPIDSGISYLACDKSVFRSTDAGLNWTQGKVSFTQFITGSARSLVLDASIPGVRTLYTGILGVGVFRSKDGGLNWTQILSSTTPGVQPPFGKVVVDIAPPTSPPNPAGVQVIYAALRGIGGNGNAIGIYLSIDQGATWSQQSVNNPPKPQSDYAFHMAVDPGSPGDGINDTIYLGGVGQARSDDSGNNFVSISKGLHADTHAWAFVRQPSPTPSIVYCGNDGGLFKSIDKGSTWIPLNDVSTGLFYNITTRYANDDFGSQVGALQDNSTYTHLPAFSSSAWKGNILGGDGGDVEYNSDQRYLYASVWDLGSTVVYRSTDDGLTFNKNITPWDGTTDRGGYIASIATDPNTSGIVYVSGSQNLWQSFEYGNDSTWRIITPISGSCDDINVAKGNGNHVVVCIDGKVFLTTNALADSVGPPSGVMFTDITRNLPGRYVTRVKFDPDDPNTIYAVLGGFYRRTDPPEKKGHVFRTGINESNWTNISPEVNVPCSALALDGGEIPSTIYVGTEFGILRSVDGGSFWSVFDDLHFPRVPVMDLEMDYPGFGHLVAATFGRGAFIYTKLSTIPIIALNLENNLDFGTVREGPVNLKLQILNLSEAPNKDIVGGDLLVKSVQRLMGSTSFSVLPTPNTPIPIRGGEHVDFTVQYNPSGAGVQEFATIRIISNDYPTAPYLDVLVTGRQEPYD